MSKITDNRAAESFQVPDVIAKDLARHLENQIIFGDLKPGMRLVEEEFVQRFNVSRSPVREAFRMLEQEGLASRASRRGVWVSHIDLDDLDEVYTCRLVLEGLAAELAAANRTSDEMNGIAAIVDAMADDLDRGDMRGFFHRNIQLSTNIHAAAHNRTLKRLLGSIGKQAFRYRYLAYEKAPEMMQTSVEGHREILEAMRRQNARYARSLMEDLIQRSWAAVRKAFSEEGSFRATP